jgi:hypothetical protein
MEQKGSQHLQQLKGRSLFSAQAGHAKDSFVACFSGFDNAFCDIGYIMLEQLWEKIIKSAK